MKQLSAYDKYLLPHEIVVPVKNEFTVSDIYHWCVHEVDEGHFYGLTDDSQVYCWFEDGATATMFKLKFA